MRVAWKVTRGATRSGVEGPSWATALTTAAGSLKALIAARTLVRSAVSVAPSKDGTTAAASGLIGGRTTPAGGATGTSNGMPVTWMATRPAIVPAAGTATKV